MAEPITGCNQRAYRGELNKILVVACFFAVVAIAVFVYYVPTVNGYYFDCTFMTPAGGNIPPYCVWPISTVFLVVFVALGLIAALILSRIWVGQARARQPSWNNR